MVKTIDFADNLIKKIAKENFMIRKKQGHIKTFNETLKH